MNGQIFSFKGQESWNSISLISLFERGGHESTTRGPHSQSKVFEKETNFLPVTPCELSKVEAFLLPFGVCKTH